MAQILLIEPDKILAGHIRHYFANAKYSVIPHHDLQQAIISADKHSPAAVIIELQLAGRSGIEFLYEFRSYPDWQNVPIIIYTSLKDTQLQSYARVFDDLNIQRILHKPDAGLGELLAATKGSLATAIV